MRVRHALTALVAAVLLAPLAAAAPGTPGPVATVAGQAHVAGLGWLPTQTDTIGTTGQSRRLEAVRLNYPVDVQVYVAGLGWLSWVGASHEGAGEQAGTTGQSRAIEAIRVALIPTGQDWGSVTYTCHVAGAGWLGWYGDGDTCGTPGSGVRMEALQVRFTPYPDGKGHTEPTTVEPTTEPTAAGTARFAVTADTGMGDTGAAVLSSIGESDVQWVGHLGDMAYQPGAGIEQQWCDYVKARITQPVQLIPGNHEAQNGDGKFAKYAACLPDRLGVHGDYARGVWYVDDGPVRYITASPMIALPQGTLTYAPGSWELAWTRDWIRDAKQRGLWVVAAMHVPCLTNGIHGCEGSASLTDMLLAEKADLILAGHDHNYGRTHQITGTTNAPTVVDSDGQFTQGAGSVLAIVGNGGHKPREITGCPAMWAACSGTNSPGGGTTGWLRIDATGSTLTARLVATSGPLTDSWTIAR